MLIKVTARCSAGCSHCMEEATPQDEHMSWETFLQALALTESLESRAWASGCPAIVLLSGGECTEHPELVRFVQAALRRGFRPVLLTNGLRLADEKLQRALLESERVLVQVTCDTRFYRQMPTKIAHPRVEYCAQITRITPLGRAAASNFDAKGVAATRAPLCFNFRSAVRHWTSIERAIETLRRQYVLGRGYGQCTPSIAPNGDVCAGESRFCHRIGTVRSSPAELTRKTLEIRCNRCGLVDKLGPDHRQAIGETAA